MQFGEVQHVETKFAGMPPEWRLVDLGGDSVEDVWSKVSGRTMAARRWCRLVADRLDAQMPIDAFRRSDRTFRRSDLYQDRQVQVSERGQEEGEDTDDEQLSPGGLMALPTPSAQRTDWHRATRLLVTGGGGEGKTWWTQQLLLHGDGRDFNGVRGSASRLKSDNPDDTPLPVWLDPATLRETSQGWQADGGLSNPDVRSDLVEAAIRWTDPKGELTAADTEAIRGLLDAQLDPDTQRAGALVVIDAAEQLDQLARALLDRSSPLGTGGRIIVSSRPIGLEQHLDGDGSAHVLLRPLSTDAVGRIVRTIRADDADVDEVSRLITSGLRGASALVITRAASLTPQTLRTAIGHGVAWVLLEAVAKSLKGKAGTRREYGQVAQYVGDPDVVADILARAGYRMLEALARERTSAKHPGLAFVLESSDLTSWHPEADGYGHQVHHELPLRKLLVADGVLIDRDGDYLFGNDVLRDLAVACACVADPQTDPTHDDYDRFLAPEYSDDAPGSLRDYLADDATVQQPTMTYVGEIANRRFNLRLDEISRRLDEMVIRLARPTPLSELPRWRQP